MVEASNGPGQRTQEEKGRRVRYVDSVRAGEDLQSTFLAVHEPHGAESAASVHTVERLVVSAGPEAVVLKIEHRDGVYLALNNFETYQEIEGIGFQGTFALVYRPTNAPATYLAVGASQLRIDGTVCVDGPPRWESVATRVSGDTLKADAAPPAAWRSGMGDAKAYARILSEGDWTGIPLEHVADDGTVRATRFPLPPLSAVDVLRVCEGTLP